MNLALKILATGFFMSLGALGGWGAGWCTNNQHCFPRWLGGTKRRAP